MNRTLRYLSTLIGLTTLCVSSRYSDAQTRFSFTKIIDTSGDYTNVVAPLINNSGMIAFGAAHRDGASEILVYDQGQLNTIADTRTSIGLFTGLALNNAGMVAYSAIQNPFSAQIVVHDGQNATQVMSSADGFRLFGNLSLNDSGNIAFVGETNDGWGVFLKSGANLQTVAPPNLANVERVGLSMNNSNQVTFTSRDSGFERAKLFVGDGTNLQVIDRNPPAIALINEGAKINEDGRVVFSATSSNGTNNLYLLYGDTLTSLVDSTGGFQSFSAPFGFNHEGEVTFMGLLDTGEYGIFAGTDPIKDRVILLGDILDGSTIEFFNPVLNGLNDRGQIVFTATFPDGRTGLYVANPVPEPGAMSLFLATGAGGLFWYRRKRDAIG